MRLNTLSFLANSPAGRNHSVRQYDDFIRAADHPHLMGNDNHGLAVKEPGERFLSWRLQEEMPCFGGAMPVPRICRLLTSMEKRLHSADIGI